MRRETHDRIRSIHQKSKLQLMSHLNQTPLVIPKREAQRNLLASATSKLLKLRSEPHPSIAFTTAALANNLVESNVGKGDDSGVTSKGISVHPRTTASQPSSFNPRITST